MVSAFSSICTQFFLQKKLTVNSLNNLKTTLLYPMFVTVNNGKGGMNEVTYKFQF